MASGGPHQYAELRNEFMIRVTDQSRATSVVSELDKLGLSSNTLNNVPVINAKPLDTIETVFENVSSSSNVGQNISKAVKEVQHARNKGSQSIPATVPTIAATDAVKRAIESIHGVDRVDFVETLADFGPQNLRVDVPNLESGTSSGKNKIYNLNDIVKALGVEQAWNTTKGENAIACIFDTSFSEDMWDKSRILDTFYGGDAKSAFSAPSQGHGTMTSGAMAASENGGKPFNGIAPKADVILIRITDSKDQIKSNIIANGWDWLLNKNLSKPVVTNHSYGTPLCSARPRSQHCDSVHNDIVKAANAEAGITSVYAAGNSSMHCGHRPSGLTNGIASTNSLEQVISVGAMMSNGKEIQRYSSHGRGDCAPIADPKPNVSIRIPQLTYWGKKGGWGTKDMSYGVIGSSGGTSHASPLVAGLVTLMQSAAVDKYQAGNQSGNSMSNTRSSGVMQTEEVKYILEQASKPPHPNQINQIGFGLTKKGYGARFGHGEPDINKALEMI